MGKYLVIFKRGGSSEFRASSLKELVIKLRKKRYKPSYIFTATETSRAEKRSLRQTVTHGALFTGHGKSVYSMFSFTAAELKTGDERAEDIIKMMNKKNKVI